MLFSQAGLMGGGGAPPAQEAPAQQEPAGGEQAPAGGEGAPPAQALPMLTEEGKFNAGWYKGNPELEAVGKQLDKFQSVPDMAKSYAHLEKNRMVPTDGAEATAIEAFRTANNIPATAEAYDIQLPEQLPEGVIMDDGALNQYKEIFHSLNLTPHQAQKLTEAHLQTTGEQVASMQGENYAMQEQLETGLKNEWGVQYGAKIESATATFNSLVAKSGVDVNQLPFTNDPNFAKLMSAVSELTSESHVKGALGASAPTLQGGKAEANDVMTNSKNPDYQAFWDSTDPRHSQVTDRVSMLNR